jgi:hypothetical protein
LQEVTVTEVITCYRKATEIAVDTLRNRCIRQAVLTVSINFDAIHAALEIDDWNQAIICQETERVIACIGVITSIAVRFLVFRFEHK